MKIFEKNYSEIEKYFILFFFFAIFYLITFFHYRPTAMLDQALTFDGWWYFYDRLKHGQIPLWNPYYLFGKIAVQWNYIPFSLFLLPFYFHEPSISLFPIYNALSNFLVFISMYVVARSLRFSRILSVIPIVILVTSGFRYWSSFLHFGSFLFFYPFAVSIYLKNERYHDLNLSDYFKMILFFSLSICGLRLEKTVYCTVYFIVMIFSISFEEFLENKNWYKGLCYGILCIVISLLSNLWQFIIIVESLISSSRISISSRLDRILDPLLYKWLFISFVSKPSLILSIIFLVLSSIITRYKNFDRNIILAIIFVPLVILCSLISRDYVSELITYHQTNFIDMDFKSLILFEYDHLFTMTAFVWVALAFMAFYCAVDIMSLSKIMMAFSLIFAGYSVDSYCGGSWPLSDQRHSFFLPETMLGISSVASVLLFLRRRLWILLSLIIFHLIGENISLITWYLFGVPWNISRASLAELPMKIYMYLIAIEWMLVFFKKYIDQIIESYSLFVKFIFLIVMLVFFELNYLPSGFITQSITNDEFIHSSREFSLSKWTSFGDNTQVIRGFEFKSSSDEGKITPSQNLLDGEVSLIAPSFGNSYLRALIEDTSEGLSNYKGRVVRFSVQVRNNLSKENTIELDIQNGISTQLTTLIVSGNKWQKIYSKAFYVPRESKFLYLTTNLINDRSDSNSKIYLKDFVIESTKVVNEGDYLSYLPDFPFKSIPKNLLFSYRNDWMLDAQNYTLSLKDKFSWPQYQRVKIDDGIIKLSGDDSRYLFLPSYSKTINTAPVYASEIPETLSDIFFTRKNLYSDLKSPHPESSPILRILTFEYWNKSNFQIDTNYFHNLTIMPHNDGWPVGNELLSEMGSTRSRVYLSERFIKLSTVQEEREVIYSLIKNGIDTSRLLTSSDDRYFTNYNSGSTGTTKIISDTPEEIVIDVNSDKTGRLVLEDLWSRAWTATVNNRAALVYRGLIGMRFVDVPAGKSTVVFSYNIPWFRQSLMLSIFIWFIILFVTVYDKLRKNNFKLFARWCS